MWGSFPQVRDPLERSYTRAYWRFLLGWETPPSRSSLDPEQLRELRRLARFEVTDYQSFAQSLRSKRQGGAHIHEFPKIRPPPQTAS